MPGLRHATLLVAILGVHGVRAQNIDTASTQKLASNAAPREGLASWYGPWFHGRVTACGEIFDQHALTAAHRTLPFGTRIAVTNLDTGCRVVLRVNDRGPYHGPRILDCSRAGAEALGFIEKGVTRIRWEIVDARGRVIPGDSAPRPAAAPREPPVPISMEDAS